MKSPISLRTRVIWASFWTLGGHAVGQVLRLVSNLVMTRLLAPEMFGVMAIANILMTGLALLSDIGLGQNVVQSRRGDDPRYLNSVWTAQILRGALIWILAVGAAAAVWMLQAAHGIPAESVYASPSLPGVLAILSLTALIGGFFSTRVASAVREIVRGRLTLIEILTQASSLVWMVAWAQFDPSIWALPTGAVAGYVVHLALSHFALPGIRNRVVWDREALGEILGFGKWIFLTSVIGYLASSSDRLILGGVIDARSMGLYSMAVMIVAMVQDLLSRIAGSVALPALSEVARDRPDELRRVYYRIRLPYDAFALFILGALLAGGVALIGLMYDARFRPAGAMVGVLAISLFEYRISAMAGQCFVAMGLPRLLTPLSILRFAVIVVAVPLAFRRWGLEGAVWAAGAGSLVSLPAVYAIKARLGLLDFRRELVTLPAIGAGYISGLLFSWIVGLR